MSRKLRRQDARLGRHTDGSNEPNAVDFYAFQLAKQQGDDKAALRELDLLGKRFPRSAAIHHFASEILAAAGDFRNAMRQNELALRLAPNNLPILCMKVQCLIFFDEARGCREILERVLAEDPDYVSGLKLMARLLKRERDQLGYLRTLKHIIRIKPNDPEVILELSIADSAYFDDATLDRISKLSESKQTSTKAKIKYSFSVANVLLHREQDEEAFATYEKANALLRETDRGSALHPAKALDIWRRTGISRAFFEERSEHGIRDKSLVLVLGCSRSGKSLVESILSLYPGTKAVGESARTARLMTDFMNALELSPTNYLNRRSAEASRHDANLYLQTVGIEDFRLRIDTMPGNLPRLPLLSLWFPDAPLIFCRRNILDLGVSEYFKYYGTGNRELFDLYDIGQYIKAYESLMDFFESVLPNPIIRVDYDEMVDAPRETALRLFKLLSLDTDGVDFSQLQPGFSEKEHFVHPIGSLDAVTTIRKHARGIGTRFEHHLASLIEGYNTPFASGS